jgi:hypothetical protein
MVLLRRRRYFDGLRELPESAPRLVSRWPPGRARHVDHRPFDWEADCPELIRPSQCHVRLVEAGHALPR